MLERLRAVINAGGGSPDVVDGLPLGDQHVAFIAHFGESARCRAARIAAARLLVSRSRTILNAAGGPCAPRCRAASAWQSGRRRRTDPPESASGAATPMPRSSGRTAPGRISRGRGISGRAAAPASLAGAGEGACRAQSGLPKNSQLLASRPSAIQRRPAGNTLCIPKLRFHRTFCTSQASDTDRLRRTVSMVGRHRIAPAAAFHRLPLPEV